MSRQAELATPDPHAELGPPPTISGQSLAGWGGGPRVNVELATPATVDELRAAIVSSDRPVIARGMGRSYGDAAQLRGGRVLDVTGLAGAELDAESGVVHAEGGATLKKLLDLVAPAGFVLPVVPGTQHVSLGGAIASDIHGKNHGSVGTFGSHVRELGLLLASGEVVTLTPANGGELLAATLGGMGLTGIILWARVALRHVGSVAVAVDTDRVQTLEQAFAVLDDRGGPYRVAWLDLLGRPLARGVVTRADHLAESSPPATRAGGATVAARMTVPARWPASMLQPSAVRAFNELRFRRSPRHRTGQVQSFGAHMFPLDVLNAWPRLYGPAGFVQYQLVVPRGQEQAIERLLVELRRSRVPCYLAVLKDFGPHNGAPLSFPIAGWTLALDLPRAAPDLEPLLRRFDRLVVEAGGRVYLAKDSRTEPEVLAAMYPRLDEWRAIRDRVDPQRRWRSDLALRTELVQAD